MKKITLTLLTSFVLFTMYCNFFNSERVIYLPFDIPGPQMAATIPPFGIFIEAKYKDEGDGKGSILAHEKVHWDQYERMGLFKFYYEYFSEYLKHGRIHNHWMEVEARKLST